MIFKLDNNLTESGVMIIQISGYSIHLLVEVRSK